MYKVVVMRWRKWIVRAKSGTSFERDTKTSRNMTLSIPEGDHNQQLIGILLITSYQWTTHLIKQFSNHTNPNIHPMVVSPRRESQPKTRSSENGAP